MSKKSKIILIVLAVVALLVALILLIKKPEKTMNKFEFPTTIVVENNTNFKVDTITKVLLNKVMNIDTITLKIYYMPNHLKGNGDIEIKAFLMPNKFDKNEYLLFLNKDNRESEYMIILCHESVHLKQYKSGDLVFVDQTADHIFYKGKKIIFKDVKYESRPYEIEAFKEQNKIYRKLKRLLYKKL